MTIVVSLLHIYGCLTTNNQFTIKRLLVDNKYQFICQPISLYAVSQQLDFASFCSSSSDTIQQKPNVRFNLTILSQSPNLNTLKILHSFSAEQYKLTFSDLL